ncbi:MAG: dockerin type I domain-containing protein [Planctomycetota bacterium]
MKNTNRRKPVSSQIVISIAVAAVLPLVVFLPVILTAANATSRLHAPAPISTAVSVFDSPPHHFYDGDLNNDGVINMLDVDLMSRIGNLVVGRTNLDGCEHYDLNEDGIITTDDMARLIERIVITPENIHPLEAGDPGQTPSAILYCTIADYVVNGIIDQFDYQWWLDHANGPAAHGENTANRGKLYTDGDCNGDGLVDSADEMMILELWLNSIDPEDP